MKYVFQIGLISGISLAGELLYKLLPFPVPASVYGLVLLFLLLSTKVVRLSWVEETADFMVAIMPVLFVEPSVKLMTSFGLIRGHAAALIAVCVVSTVAAIAVTGVAAQAVIRRKKRKEGAENE